MSANVSVPAASAAPRGLTDEERGVLARVADCLVPGNDSSSPASAEPGFWASLAVALDARSDAFDDITSTLAGLAVHQHEELWTHLRQLDSERPGAFQALSTVVVGAWLLTPGVRDRIGYPGQQSEKAGLEEAADEISSGILDPVIDRDPQEGPRWIR